MGPDPSSIKGRCRDRISRRVAEVTVAFQYADQRKFEESLPYMVISFVRRHRRAVMAEGGGMGPRGRSSGAVWNSIMKSRPNAAVPNTVKPVNFVGCRPGAPPSP
jgi:hypothetical protein